MREKLRPGAHCAQRLTKRHAVNCATVPGQAVEAGASDLLIVNDESAGGLRKVLAQTQRPQILLSPHRDLDRPRFACFGPIKDQVDLAIGAAPDASLCADTGAAHEARNDKTFPAVLLPSRLQTFDFER
jgi:hypothetical protein